MRNASNNYMDLYMGVEIRMFTIQLNDKKCFLSLPLVFT